MRFIRAIHDLTLALVVGGIFGGAFSAVILFREAPSREVAGRVGQAIFDLLGIVVFGLSLVLLASRAFLLRTEPPSRARSVALALSVACVLLACAIALGLTPAMGRIWRTAPHAPDGSGLVEAARVPFMRLHGIANLSYLALLGCAAAIILLQPADRLPR
ncbi:MAG TPA: DUF4149 domain-containing protein [Candidatus Polarisedimenticolia bacterium]